MSDTNHFSLQFDARSENEGFARMAVAGFLVDLDPAVDTLEDVRMAVSEAVTNSVVHGYEEDENGQITLSCSRQGRWLTVVITDQGKGIDNIEEAMKPYYTTRPELERTGMGFAFMQAFMDQVRVESSPGQGTEVTMEKYITGQEDELLCTGQGEDE